jgi:long-chain acyl-CoA synthetase
MPANKEGQEVMMTALPLFHSYAMTVCMNHTIYLAGTMILIPNPRVLDHVLKSINKHKPTLFPGVPAMYVSVTNHPDVKQYDVSSIRACISGAAGLPPEVQEGFERLTGGKLVEGYGLSEATPVTHAILSTASARKEAGSASPCLTPIQSSWTSRRARGPWKPAPSASLSSRARRS